MTKTAQPTPSPNLQSLNHSLLNPELPFDNSHHQTLPRPPSPRIEARDNPSHTTLFSLQIPRTGTDPGLATETPKKTHKKKKPRTTPPTVQATTAEQRKKPEHPQPKANPSTPKSSQIRPLKNRRRQPPGQVSRKEVFKVSIFFLDSDLG